MHSPEEPFLLPLPHSLRSAKQDTMFLLIWQQDTDVWKLGNSKLAKDLQRNTALLITSPPL